MTVHIGASPGDIAETVLMPGDPLRAKWAAETFLDDARCVNEVRGMLGFTGTVAREPGDDPWLGHGHAQPVDLRQ
jgi:purine-nucleoside phosphorylase